MTLLLQSILSILQPFLFPAIVALFTDLLNTLFKNNTL